MYHQHPRQNSLDLTKTKNLNTPQKTVQEPTVPLNFLTPLISPLSTNLMDFQKPEQQLQHDQELLKKLLTFYPKLETYPIAQLIIPEQTINEEKRKISSLTIKSISPFSKLDQLQ